MDKIFDLTVRFAYRRALAFGADDRNAFKAALSVIFDAKPDLEETEARIMLSIILGATPDLSAGGLPSSGLQAVGWQERRSALPSALLHR